MMLLYSKVKFEAPVNKSWLYTFFINKYTFSYMDKDKIMWLNKILSRDKMKMKCNVYYIYILFIDKKLILSKLI